MENNELEFYTSKQLIDELVARSTFQGAIIHSRDDCKDPEFSSRNFIITYNHNLNDGCLCGILRAIADRVENELKEDDEPTEYLNEEDD